MGKLVERLNFGRIKERGEMPHFLEFQLDSYEDFLQTKETPNSRKNQGLEAAFREVFPIESSNGDIRLEYMSYELHEAEAPLNDELECKKRGKTYSSSLKVRLQLQNKKNGNEIQETLVYFGEVPTMTPRGTFIINGAERVVVSQLHRSPGVSFNKEVNIQTGKDLYSGKIIPYKGTWLEFETDKDDCLQVKIDRKKKVLATVFLKAVDFFESNDDVKEFFLDTKEIDLQQFYTNPKFKSREDILEKLSTEFEGSFLKQDLYDMETGEVKAFTGDLITKALVEQIVDDRVEKILCWKVNPEDI
ncbi:MAG: DNA-directed RNA polymerase subunit beta, partial [Fusobacteriaceae bacterium]